MQCVPGSLFAAPTTHAESLGTRLTSQLEKLCYLIFITIIHEYYHNNDIHPHYNIH